MIQLFLRRLSTLRLTFCCLGGKIERYVFVKLEFRLNLAAAGKKLAQQVFYLRRLYQSRRSAKPLCRMAG
jgi:hypothetical protein